jgi:hypothetical protein
MKIERDGEAIAAYSKYLESAGPELPADAREQTQRDLMTMKSSAVEVVISLAPMFRH